MGTFLGKPITAEPPAPRPSGRHRLESCAIGAVVACPLALVVLVLTGSVWSSGAVIAGSAIVAWLRPFRKSGPFDRPAVILWSFCAALMVALLDTVDREVLRVMAGHQNYPPFEREPPIYFPLMAIVVAGLAVVIWLPMFVVGRVAAAATVRLHARSVDPRAPARD